MRQHPADLFALLCGLALAMAGSALVISQTSDLSLDGRGVTAGCLIALGAVALLATITRGRRDASSAIALGSATPADTVTVDTVTVDSPTVDSPTVDSPTVESPVEDPGSVSPEEPTG